MLFIGQAFIYNGITFNLGTLLTTFYDVSSGPCRLFFVIFALGQLRRAGDAGPALRHASAGNR